MISLRMYLITVLETLSYHNHRGEFNSGLVGGENKICLIFFRHLKNVIVELRMSYVLMVEKSLVGALTLSNDQNSDLLAAVPNFVK